MPRDRRRAATIKAGTFANVCHAYLASPKFAALAPNTQVSYRRVLRLAELPETLGAISTVELRPAHVQAFLDGLSDRPAQQLNALRVLHTVERWAIVRDLLMWPITMGL